MAVLKPFKGIRPTREIAEKIASRPYDVLNSQEAREEAKGNEYSLLHIIKPEIDLEQDVDIHSNIVYNKAKENYNKFMQNGWLVQDSKDHIYIYAQTMHGKTQYGVVGGASVDDYLNGVILKHELTRPDKEEDRMKHVRVNNANIEPVFFSYPAHLELDSLVKEYADSNVPEYDFVADDGISHHFWVVKDDEVTKRIVLLFKEIPYTYVADGHHRTAAAARVGVEKRKNNPNFVGDEEYNFFLAVHFPHNQLTIIDYNRVVRDMNGLTPGEFLKKLEKGFSIEEKGTDIYKPDKLHNFSMYLEGKWYSLTANENFYDDNDPVGALDVTILTKHVLDPVLDIKDLRRSERIDFVGGIRGLEGLKKRVDSGEMKIAFALFPVSMKQLIRIADTGNIMPPKTTWFEPKLRSGLIIHSLEDKEEVE
jgi:uncharacterized protein (DUF1015 family)